MRAGKQEIQERMAHFERVCRGAGVKLTHQRLEIFREVAKSGDHPDANSVHLGVRKRLPTVSLDTVYRTLWLLNDLNLVATLGASWARTRFDANLSRHHHFVCERCGMTRDFYCEEFDKLQLPESAKEFGRIQRTQVEARGVCGGCTGKKLKPGDRRK